MYYLPLSVHMYGVPGAFVITDVIHSNNMRRCLAVAFYDHTRYINCPETYVLQVNKSLNVYWHSRAYRKAMNS